MEKPMLLAMASLAMAGHAPIIGSARDEDEPPTMVLRRQPETYRVDDKVKLRKGGKCYAITADPSRIKIKAARKQSMKNRKKK